MHKYIFKKNKITKSGRGLIPKRCAMMREEEKPIKLMIKPRK